MTFDKIVECFELNNQSIEKKIDCLTLKKEEVKKTFINDITTYYYSNPIDINFLKKNLSTSGTDITNSVFSKRGFMEDDFKHFDIWIPFFYRAYSKLNYVKKFFEYTNKKNKLNMILFDQGIESLYHKDDYFKKYMKKEYDIQYNKNHFSFLSIPEKTSLTDINSKKIEINLTQNINNGNSLIAKSLLKLKTDGYPINKIFINSSNKNLVKTLNKTYLNIDDLSICFDYLNDNEIEIIYQSKNKNPYEGIKDCLMYISENLYYRTKNEMKKILKSKVTLF
jgi:hypothetical protein